MVSREFGDEVVASDADAGVAVGNVRETFIAISRKLNFQPTS